MPDAQTTISEVPAVNGVHRNGAAAPPGIRIVTRVIDWVTNDRMQLINITDRINEIVKKTGIRDGLVHLQSLHTTASVFLNEWQDALVNDVRSYLEGMVHRDHDANLSGWQHNDPRYSDCERRNADSHMRGMLMGQTLSLQVRNSAVLLGTWQQIIFAEFDGPRSRSMSVQITGI